MHELNSAVAVSTRDRILKAAAAIGLLGTGSNRASSIVAALCRPDVNAGRVAALIGTEPALYARVLRVANSPYYGQSRSIKTVDRALVLLGLDAVRGIAAAACLQRAVPQRTEHAPIDMSEVVRHSIATAAAAEALAGVRHAALAPDAFIAGLLHNLGVVVQVHVDAAGIRSIIERCKAGDTRAIRELEDAHAAVPHEHCAAVIFEAWQLPVALTAAARHHHAPMDAEEANRALASIISLAATLALAAGHTFALEPAPVERPACAIAWLKLDDAQVDAVAAALPVRVQELTEALLGG